MSSKISALPAAAALGGTEELAGVQGGSNVKVTPDQVKARVLADASITGALADIAQLDADLGDVETDVANLQSSHDEFLRDNNWKAAVRIAVDEDVDVIVPGGVLSGTSMNPDDRILLMAQTNKTENGLYVWTAAAAALIRTTDTDTGPKMLAAKVVVMERTYAEQTFVLKTNAPITLGVTDLDFVPADGSTYNAATVDATPTSTGTILIPSSRTVLITGYVTARRTGGAAGAAEDGAAYRFEGVYKTVGGTPTLIGQVVTTIGESQAGWNVTMDAVAGGARVMVTGAVNNNIDWTVSGLTVRVV